jgi:hypothetical protein
MPGARAATAVSMSAATARGTPPVASSVAGLITSRRSSPCGWTKSHPMKNVC